MSIDECPRIASMMEAASASGTSLNFNQTTRCNVPTDSQSHSPPQVSLCGLSCRISVLLRVSHLVSTVTVDRWINESSGCTKWTSRWANEAVQRRKRRLWAELLTCYHGERSTKLAKREDQRSEAVEGTADADGRCAVCDVSAEESDHLWRYLLHHGHGSVRF